MVQALALSEGLTFAPLKVPRPSVKTISCYDFRQFVGFSQTINCSNGDF